MSNKNINLTIHGTIFNDFVIKGLKKKQFIQNKSSVIKENINYNCGGVGNILNLKFDKDTLLNLYDDTEKKDKKNFKFIQNFKKSPCAVIFENFDYQERLSIVSNGLIKNTSAINVKKNELFLGYYIECLPVIIKKNNGIVVFDFNDAPQIISNKNFTNNLKKSNYILKSLGENNKIIDKNLTKLNTTIIEHSPKKVVINIINKKKITKKTIINHFFKSKKKKSIGLGDLFAYFFCQNLKKKIILEKNISNIFEKISNLI